MGNDKPGVPKIKANLPPPNTKFSELMHTDAHMKEIAKVWDFLIAEQGGREGIEDVAIAGKTQHMAIMHRGGGILRRHIYYIITHIL